MSSYNYPVFGVVFGRGGNGSGPATSGIPFTVRNVDNSVEREKFTDDATPSGELSWEYTRAIDIHTSVSTLKSDDSGGARTVTERKVFPSGWTIFNAQGVAVGATAGTTDTDVTPSGQGTL